MIQEPFRRRSKVVKLVLVGVAGTAATMSGGCSKVSYQRNIYANAADCARDYSQTVCSSKGELGFGNFKGPLYRLVNGIPSACQTGDPGSGAFTSSRKISTQVDRNGFGVSCNRRRTGTGSSSRQSFWGG